MAWFCFAPLGFVLLRVVSLYFCGLSNLYSVGLGLLCVVCRCMFVKGCHMFSLSFA